MKIYCPFCHKEEEYFVEKRDVTKYKGVNINTFENVAKQEQKGLNKKERAFNAQSSYVYIEDSLKDYKNIILVDDIITSGATMYACAFQLYKHGANSVVPIAFAKDNYKERGVRKNAKRNTKYNFARAVKGFVRNGS